MVHGYQQHMLPFSKTDQTPTDQWTLLKIEPSARFRINQLPKLLRSIIDPTKIMLQQDKTTVLCRCNSLDRLSLQRNKCRPQSLVPIHDTVQRPAQSLTIKMSFQTQAKRKMICLASAL